MSETTGKAAHERPAGEPVTQLAARLRSQACGGDNYNRRITACADALAAAAERDALRADLAAAKRNLMAIAVVGQIDGHDCIRRESVRDIINALIAGKGGSNG